MRTDINIGVFDVIIFLGVFQGLLLSWFFIKNSGGNKKANRYQGLFLVSISLAVAVVIRKFSSSGAGYRFVSGIDPANEYVEITHLTNQDLSGVSVSIGLKITKAAKK